MLIKIYEIVLLSITLQDEISVRDPLVKKLISCIPRFLFMKPTAIRRLKQSCDRKVFIFKCERRWMLRSLAAV